MKVLKFGGKSLSNDGIDNVLNIIEKVSSNSKIMLVLSARGGTTDYLENLLDKACEGINFQKYFVEFCNYQNAVCPNLDLSQDFLKLKKTLEKVQTDKKYDLKIKDEILSFGEILSCKTVTHLLQKRGYKAQFKDTRKLLKTDSNFGSAKILDEISEKNIINHFANWNDNTIQVITGFIASNENGLTTTLGRNGSNYSAALLTNYLNAEELQNWTHVSGIYTADPNIVNDANKIENLSFEQANELIELGTSVLHTKTILPLIKKKIPIRILNTYRPQDKGTLINTKGTERKIKALSTLKNVALISLECKSNLNKKNIDSRISTALAQKNIQSKILSQSLTEKGIEFVISLEETQKVKFILEKEFQKEFQQLDILRISINKDITIISVIGKHFNESNKTYGTLIRNSIKPYLCTSTLSGEHTSLIIKNSDISNSLNAIHCQMFGKRDNKLKLIFQ